MIQPTPTRYVTISKHDKPIVGTIRVPGSKSLTNRALILAALAHGQSTLRHVLHSDDTQVMMTALKQMGVEIEQTEPTTLRIKASGKLQAPKDTLFLGNAGTATRFLTAISTLVDGTVVIDGDEYMQARPIQPLVNALQDLGVKVTCKIGCPPLTIEGSGGFDGDEVMIDGNLSSQYVSALLMLAPFCQDEFKLRMQDAHIGGQGYINLTLALMEKFGVVTNPIADGWRIKSQRYEPTLYEVEPDASSMTYIWAMEALTGGNIDTGCDAQQMTQPDAQVYDIIRAYPSFPAVIDGAQFQDAIPTLAVMAAFSGKKIHFTGIENLRVKECDRIAALREGLCQIHPDLAWEDGDDLWVDGSLEIRRLSNLAVCIDSKDDHRIAMCFALAGLLIDGIAITNPACVAKTYPSYWQTLTSLGVDVTFSDRL